MPRQSKLAALLDERNTPGTAQQADIAHVVRSVRPKAPNGTYNERTWHRMIFPVPIALKCDVMKICREQNLTQAEMGRRVFEAAIRDPRWLQAVLKR